MLSPQRTRDLLRSGRYSPVDVGSMGVSPAARARKHLSVSPRAPSHSLPLLTEFASHWLSASSTYESASLILRASAPWSPAAHELWGWQQRARAVELLKVGYQLRDRYRCVDAILDVWIAHVLPLCVTWDMRGGVVSPPVPVTRRSQHGDMLVMSGGDW